MDWSAGEAMKENDSGKILSSFRTGTIDVLCSYQYDEMLPLLRFIDKYVRKVVNGDGMKRWNRRNIHKTLIHRLTPADIAYATLTYENKSAVWVEDLKNKRDETTSRVAKQRYHVQKGARVKKYCDGWNEDGRKYYMDLTSTYARLWDNEAFCQDLDEHWRKYEHQNHMSMYKRKATEADLGHSDEGSDNDGSGDEIDIPYDENDSQLNDVLNSETTDGFV